MSISIYKPNSKNTGCAFSFRYGVQQKNQEPCLFINAIQQYNWNEESKTGSFSQNRNDPEKNITLKFNEFECGSMLSSLTNRYEYNTFHTYGENKTTIKLSPWDKEIKVSHLNKNSKKFEQKTQVLPAFGISITRNGSDTFKIPIEPGEIEVIKELLSKIIEKILIHRISIQIKSQNND